MDNVVTRSKKDIRPANHLLNGCFFLSPDVLLEDVTKVFDL